MKNLWKLPVRHYISFLAPKSSFLCRVSNLLEQKLQMPLREYFAVIGFQTFPVYYLECLQLQCLIFWCRYIKQNDTQQNDIQQNDIQQNDTQQNDIQQNGIQQNDTQLLSSE